MSSLKRVGYSSPGILKISSYNIEFNNIEYTTGMYLGNPSSTSENDIFCL